MWLESSNYSLAKGTSSSPSKHAGICPVSAGIGLVPVGVGLVPASYNMFTGMYCSVRSRGAAYVQDLALLSPNSRPVLKGA